MKYMLFMLGLACFPNLSGTVLAEDLANTRDEVGKSDGQKAGNEVSRTVPRKERAESADSDLFLKNTAQSRKPEEKFCNCMPLVKPETGKHSIIQTVKPLPNVSYKLHVKKLNIITEKAADIPKAIP